MDSNMSAKDFIMYCARSFKSFVHMRDRSYSVPFEPITVDIAWYDSNVAKAKMDLYNYKNLTLAEAAVAADLEYDRYLESYNRRIADKLKAAEEYKTLLEKVEEWEPPTDKHHELKAHAIKKLHEVIAWECNIEKVTHPERETAEEWLKNRTELAEKNVEYWERSKEESIQDAKESNEWVLDLIESLKTLDNE
jgi:hypothetical protein